MPTEQEMFQKREAIKMVYPNMRVDKMKDPQVIAIYEKLKSKGKLVK